MTGFAINIEEKTARNNYFREVLFTASHSQLVVMSLEPGEEIGLETHAEIDQFIRVEAGKGKAVLNGVEYPLEDGSAVVVPAGVEHNIVNLSNTQKLKLYTIYSPPEHPDKTIHRTKEDAERAEAEHHKSK